PTSRRRCVKVPVSATESGSKGIRDQPLPAATKVGVVMKEAGMMTAREAIAAAAAVAARVDRTEVRLITTTGDVRGDISRGGISRGEDSKTARIANAADEAPIRDMAEDIAIRDSAISNAVRRFPWAPSKGLSNCIPRATVSSATRKTTTRP